MNTLFIVSILVVFKTAVSTGLFYKVILFCELIGNKALFFEFISRKYLFFEQLERKRVVLRLALKIICSILIFEIGMRSSF